MLPAVPPDADLLTLKALRIGRGDRVLLRSFDLHLRPGQIVHLLGRNGAGKTSLLEVLAGLRPPLAGEILRGAGGWHWLGHKNGLNLALTPLENLRFWCELNAVSADDRARTAALERWRVAPLRHRAVRSLSAGQKRRVALSRLSLHPRPLWLLDEPLAGLDVATVELFSGLLLEHLQGGGGALVTSHQPIPGLGGHLLERDLALEARGE
jgi:heme exporter protein A